MYSCERGFRFLASVRHYTVVQDEPAEALQSIAGIVLAILVERKKAVPEGLLKAAAILHDAALLVRPLSHTLESRLRRLLSISCISWSFIDSHTGSCCCTFLVVLHS